MIVVAQAAAQLLVVHFRLVLALTPSFSHLRVRQANDQSSDLLRLLRICWSATLILYTDDK